MVRRRNNSPADEITDELATTFTLLPWWVGPPFALAVYCVIRWPLAWLISTENAQTPTGQLLKMLHAFMPIFAAGISSLVFIAWFGVQLKNLSDRWLLNSQSGLNSIRTLSWNEFEDLLCEAFRRQGYSVQHTGSDGPDGGIDIRLQKAGQRSIVQCKHWKRRQVGVAIVREMFGLLHSERADLAIIVTSGCFSPDAVEFARRNDIRLIAGPELEQLILTVKSSRGNLAQTQPADFELNQPRPEMNASSRIPSCPNCGGEMKRSIAKTGRHVGRPFWGCRRHPDCKAVIDIQSD